MLLILHPTGNQNNKAALEGFLRARIISSFHTSIATFPGNFFGSISKLPFLREIERRSFAPELMPYVFIYPFKKPSD